MEAPPRPTTKAKQRVFLDNLIMEMEAVAADMRLLRAMLYNRSPVRRKKRTAPSTWKVRSAIRKLYAEGMSQQEIAIKLNISIGRVSEVIRGKRT